MSDFPPPPQNPADNDPFLDPELASLTALLGEAAVWEEPSADLEDSVVSAIWGELDRQIASDGDDGPTTTSRPTPIVADEADVVPIDRARRRWVAPVLAAAATLLVVAGIGIGSRFLAERQQPDHEVALAGTDLAPAATAVAEVDNTPQGTRIILDVSGLAPAPEGQYYEAWLRQNAEVGVSAGTFHLRGGDATIELWSGVTVDEYPLITVTIQDEGAGAASSGRVVLRGTVDG